MGVKDRPQCYFDVELNREPGKMVSIGENRLPGRVLKAFVSQEIAFY